MANHKKELNEEQVLDIRLPIPSNFSLSSQPPQPLEPKLQKRLLREALKAAYEQNDHAATMIPFTGQIEQLIEDDKIEIVSSLLQSLQPTNSVEAALAIQFIVTHIQGLNSLKAGNARWGMPLLAFSQTALDSLHRYRNKGMQQINVQYNVNQGQVVNIKNEKACNKERA